MSPAQKGPRASGLSRRGQAPGAFPCGIASPSGRQPGKVPAHTKSRRKRMERRLRRRHLAHVPVPRSLSLRTNAAPDLPRILKKGALPRNSIVKGSAFSRPFFPAAPVIPVQPGLCGRRIPSLGIVFAGPAHKTAGREPSAPPEQSPPGADFREIRETTRCMGKILPAAGKARAASHNLARCAADAHTAVRKAKENRYLRRRLMAGWKGVIHHPPPKAHTKSGPRSGTTAAAVTPAARREPIPPPEPCSDRLCPHSGHRSDTAPAHTPESTAGRARTSDLFASFSCPSLAHAHTNSAVIYLLSISRPHGHAHRAHICRTSCTAYRTLHFRTRRAAESRFISSRFIRRQNVSYRPIGLSPPSRSVVSPPREPSLWKHLYYIILLSLCPFVNVTNFRHDFCAKCIFNARKRAVF